MTSMSAEVGVQFSLRHGEVGTLPPRGYLATSGMFLVVETGRGGATGI